MIWTRNHLLSDSTCNIILTYNAQFVLQEIENNIRILHLLSVTVHERFTTSIEQDKLDW